MIHLLSRLHARPRADPVTTHACSGPQKCSYPSVSILCVHLTISRHPFLPRSLSRGRFPPLSKSASSFSVRRVIKSNTTLKLCYITYGIHATTEINARHPHLMYCVRKCRKTVAKAPILSNGAICESSSLYWHIVS